MDELVKLLEESADLYQGFLELEYKKYDAVVKNEIETLDDIVSKEQVFYLKIRGLEQKREKLIESMGMKGKTLKEIIDATDTLDEGKTALTEKHEQLSAIVSETKKISSMCKNVLEVRMHRVDKALSQLGEKQSTYTNGEIKHNNSKSIFSQKI